MSKPNITPLPTPVPQRSDPANFAVRADLFLGALPEFQQQMDYLADWTSEQAGNASNSANFADQRAQAAQNSAEESVTYSEASASWANGKGRWEDLSGPIEMPASVYHKGRYWHLMNNLSNVASSEPSDSNPDWEPPNSLPEILSLAGFGMANKNKPKPVLWLNIKQTPRGSNFPGFTASSSGPSGGEDGDVHYQYED